jgi:hypothetical protein
LFFNAAQYPTDESSPSYKAVQFLAEEDTSDRDIAKLGQRYALVNMFYSLGGAEWTDSLGFLSQDTHECDWNDVAADGLIKGVICENADKFVNYISIRKYQHFLLALCIMCIAFGWHSHLLSLLLAMLLQPTTTSLAPFHIMSVTSLSSIILIYPSTPLEASFHGVLSQHRVWNDCHSTRIN